MSENKQYENEYKVQAVKLAKKIGAVKAANELQIPVNMLYGWIRKVKIGSLDIGCGERSPEESLRTCLHKKYMWIFEHNFVADKAKIRRRAVARQVFFTQYATKFAEKTRVYACEDGFSLLLNLQRFFHRVFTRCCTISYAIFTISYTENTETLSAGTVRTPSVISAASPLV